MVPRAGADSFVSEHAALVRGFFLRRCPSAEDAEDLAQETFLAILTSLKRRRGDSSPSTWVWAICRHVLARHIRTLEARRRLAERLASEEATRESRREEADGRLALELKLEELGPGDRLLFSCVYERGLSIRETAGLLGRPEGTIKYQLFLLRKRLGDLISPSPDPARPSDEGSRAGPAPPPMATAAATTTPAATGDRAML